MSAYLRIAEDIRSRIERGELPAGDRAPTTRQLAEQYGVAMATAAHALRHLADQGVLRAVPRVGSIVVGLRGRASSGREPLRAREGDLSRARIVEAAIALADEQGMGALSLRAVASKIGAPVMSLYRHVRGKEELVQAMTEAALRSEPLPPEPPPAWREQIELAVRCEWRALRRHPWLARVMTLTRPEPLPSAIAYADWMFRALSQAGLSPVAQMHAHVILHGFVQGLAVNLETESDAAAESGISDEAWMDSRKAKFEALAASGRYPHFGRLLATLGPFELDFDELFEQGLAALLDGFAVHSFVPTHVPLYVPE
ncbi:MAG TPA: TetR/AcrR family transcriptional regulator C-terminal domain-containing protein [Polyangiaceae bacterium]|nr:TetR/AcrR family transcriptional regulator C-terminal domain-containing protein [Polyangiaceae bacterium]